MKMDKPLLQKRVESPLVSDYKAWLDADMAAAIVKHRSGQCGQLGAYVWGMRTAESPQNLTIDIQEKLEALRAKVAQLGDAVAELKAAHSVDVSARFSKLLNEWQLAASSSSFMEDYVMHPAFQQIVGMGPPAIPLILRELDQRPLLMWALGAITGEHPIPQDAHGDFRAMTEAWYNWAREAGLKW